MNQHPFKCRLCDGPTYDSSWRVLYHRLGGQDARVAIFCQECLDNLTGQTAAALKSLGGGLGTPEETAAPRLDTVMRLVGGRPAQPEEQTSVPPQAVAFTNSERWLLAGLIRKIPPTAGVSRIVVTRKLGVHLRLSERAALAAAESLSRVERRGLLDALVAADGDRGGGSLEIMDIARKLGLDIALMERIVWAQRVNGSAAAPAPSA